MSARVLIIADDLTGAADSAAVFAHHGASVVIPFSARTPDAEVISVTTESRELTPDLAARSVTKAFQTYGEGNPSLLYKKVDSALRGQPRAELEALMIASGRNTAIIAPAIPALNRTTIDCQQSIDGLPLHQTAVGSGRSTSDLRDCFGPNSLALGLDIVRQGASAISEFIEANQGRLIIADSETTGDLAALAQSIIAGPIPLVSAGAAGLAAELAHLLPPGSPRIEPPVHRHGPVLIVAGTRHEVTRQQVDYLERKGLTVVRPSADEFSYPEPCSPSVKLLRQRLQAGEDVVLTTFGSYRLPDDAGVISLGLAALTGFVMADIEIGGLVLTGGDVAQAVLGGLGAEAIHLTGEVESAVPSGWLEGGASPGIGVVTKAGSFGNEATLERAVCFLRS